MDVKSSLAILGTDVFGTLLAEKLLSRYGGELAVVGSSSTPEQLDNLKLIAREQPDYLPESPDNLETTREKLDRKSGFYGGKPVDVHITSEGFYLLVEKDGTYKTVGSRILILTAPAGPDLVDNPLLLPGVDSVGTGLLARDLDLPFSGVENSRAGDQIDGKLWRGDWGYETDDTASTNHGRIFVAGEAAAGRPNDRRLEDLARNLREINPGSPPPPDSDPFSPPYTDVELPHNFCPAKTKKLKNLTTRLLNEEKTGEKHVAQFKQFSGEIAAYARFRAHPRLRRLFFKSLAARRITGTSRPGKS